MLYTDFKEQILFEPIEQGADHLKIITGYTTDAMLSWHISEIYRRYEKTLVKPLTITLIVGMCSYDGLSVNIHEGLKKLMINNSVSNTVHLNVQYIYKGAPVHAKVYLWEKEDQPICAYIGSANYTQIAFSKMRNEVMKECDPLDASRYFDAIEPNSIYCNHAEVEEHITFYAVHPALKSKKNQVSTLLENKVTHKKLSFLTRTGNVGTRSGINWGQREGREPNQAYIPVPSKIAKSGFFPLKEQHFSVVTDDGKQLILRVEQQNDKAITTPSNNSLLGEYIRNRLGVSNGAFVTKEDFERYGRSDITFYKFDDEQFYMDFSVQSGE